VWAVRLWTGWRGPLDSKAAYLQPMLDAGSSRVFNCNDRARKLLKEKAEKPYFFKMTKMHGLVLIKEPVLDAGRRAVSDSIVGTKIYIPYNQDNVYEGGRSIFFDDPRLTSVLNEMFGLKGVTVEQADFNHDVKVLGILHQLPSLDGFLMRDALELEGVTTNDNYFEVSGDERTAIYEYIRRKFEPLVRAACSGASSVSSKVNQLIDKIWEAKDKDALDPLIRAFRFPDEEALTIFASWKGINFYTFEYLRGKQRREQFGVWLRDSAKPRNFVSRGDQEHLNQLRRIAIERLRAPWNAVEAVTRQYESLYANFLRVPEGVSEFLDFLNKAKEIYWRMGDSLSKINHAIYCWDTVSSGFSERKLPAEKLAELLEILQQVLTPSSERVESAVVWQ
jgi:hypothetical protein